MSRRRVKIQTVRETLVFTFYMFRRRETSPRTWVELVVSLHTKSYKFIQNKGEKPFTKGRGERVEEG